jgi:hypothetical protein
VVEKNGQYRLFAQPFEGRLMRDFKQRFGLVIPQCWRLAFVAFNLQGVGLEQSFSRQL